MLHEPDRKLRVYVQGIVILYNLQTAIKLSNSTMHTVMKMEIDLKIQFFCGVGIYLLRNYAVSFKYV